MRYAKIENNAVVETREMADNFNPTEVAHKFDFRIINVQADPAFDPLTHKLIRNQELANWDFVINPTDVEATRKVIALTQAEIDAATAAAADQAEIDQAKALYQNLMDGTVSDAVQQKILARVIKSLFGGGII